MKLEFLNNKLGIKSFFSSYDSKVSDIQNKLQSKFDNFYYISDKKKITIVKKLLSQQGEIDLNIEGYKSLENQRDLTIKFHWGHNHKFNDELSITGRMGNRHINLMAQFLVGFDIDISFFKNKKCIDVGSWTGGTLLVLKMLGASEILSLEEVQKYALITKKLCSDVYNFTDVISDGKNLYNLKAKNKYDIAYFPGVIYHLSDPVLGLRRLFNSLNDGGVCLVESAGIDSNKSIARFDGNRIFHSTKGESKKDLNRGGWNWFIPSPKCLEMWMIEAGFTNIRTYFSTFSNRVYGYGVRKKYVDITRAGFSLPLIE